jgi:hypothetical protein
MQLFKKAIKQAPGLPTDPGLLFHSITEMHSREELEHFLAKALEEGEGGLVLVEGHIFSVVPDDDDEKVHVVGPHFNSSERPGVMALRMFNAAADLPKNKR